MRPVLFFAFLVASASAAAPCERRHARDWMAVHDPLAPAVQPADCATVEQTPPDFRWPDIARDARYTVHLGYPGGRTRSLPAPQNWINWDEVLAPGTYEWRVTVEDSRGTRTSEPRRFIVDARAQPFLFPPMARVLATLKAKPHPRGLPEAGTLAAMASERPEGLKSLRREVDSKMRAQLPPEPASRSVGSNNAAVLDESKRTLNALAAYVLTREERYFQEALRRVRNLASWDPEGSTAYHVRGMDMGARMLTWALVLGYDWLHPKLDAATQARLRQVIGIRLRHIYDDVIGRRSHVARYPRNSHGQLSLTMLGVMSTLVAGDIPAADGYVAAALPLGLNLIMPWGGEDGGFANGTPYAIWDTGESLSYWYVLRWATGIDVARKAWVRNFGRFLAYFNPPGTPARLFGDGFEERQLNEQQARFGKAYANFAPSPIARWYASHLEGEDPKRLEYVMSPPAKVRGREPLPPGTPNAIHLESIGWVAMHSDLADPKRISVYFKSSPPPFGAFNHQAADQNAFVINAGGVRLAIESGYYDRYKSPHWREWLKTTRAKNAITYDGGKGQIFFEDDGERMGYGRITRFVTTPGYDIATGDATEAYGGALERAVRTIAFVRPNVVIVHDRLASSRPRRWEWNIHALNRMDEQSERRIRIENEGRSLCVEVLSGPPVRFTQTDEWTAPPRKGDRQWHGRFETAPLPSAEFIVAMDVGCTGTRVSVSGNTVRVADRSLRLEER